MIDIVYVAHNRLRFTKETTKALIRNTDWSKVGRVFVYDDNSQDGTANYLKSLRWPVWSEFRNDTWSGPVAVMNHYLTSGKPSPIWAKIDNDTMVPPLWLTECLNVMDRFPNLDLLGIEAFHPTHPGPTDRVYELAEHIGGIGLMRSAAFRSLPRPSGPSGRFGFTSWQMQCNWLIAGWMNPAIPVCLLDRMPFEPWRSLSAHYVQVGWQRPWDLYDAEKAPLWQWWAAA